MLHTTMLRRLFAPLAVATLLLAPLAPAGAQNDDVKNTKHNLSVASRLGTFTNLAVTDFGEVCAYCHIPRGGATDAPLWNRAYDTGPYQAYASPTINMTIGAPTGVSLVCLSCHDGTIGIDVITNKPNTEPVPVATGRTLATIFTTEPDLQKIFSVDLRNDHPVSVLYDSSLNLAFVALPIVKAAGLPFFGVTVNEVSCATCHHPHNKTNVPFLRTSNAASALCLTCHIK